jgi:P27 family predicted phage terminase small subunit
MPGTKHSGGRNARSAADHRTRGNYRADRHASLEAPEVPQGRPTKPDSLSAVASAEWDRMVARLEEARVLTALDDAALYQYVSLFDETEAIKADMAHTRALLAGVTVDGLGGTDLVAALDALYQLKANLRRERVQLRQGHMALRQFLVELGMTPTARSRVRPTRPTEHKPASKLLAFMGGRAAVGT